MKARYGCDMKSVRAKLMFRDKGIFEWDIIIEKMASFTWVGVCTKNFDYKTFPKHLSGIILQSTGFISKNYYCRSFGDGAKITLHLDMNKRTLTFTVNGIKYSEISCSNYYDFYP